MKVSVAAGGGVDYGSIDLVRRRINASIDVGRELMVLLMM